MLLRDRDGLTEAEFLAAYRASDYPRPSVACDMAVFAVAREEADSYRQLPEPELRLLAADGSLANTPLMRQLAARPDCTVAQFAQAVGAVYYGCLGLS